MQRMTESKRIPLESRFAMRLKMKQGFWISPLLALSVMVLAGCEESEDQTSVPVEAWRSVNPAPLARDFVGNNRRHKVLVAAIDMGTDYNNPYILNNIHFDLDADGRPVGAGFDFTGNDTWPAPYLGRSAHVAKLVPPLMKQTSIILGKSAELAQSLLPELKQFLDPDRQLAQEMRGGVEHGTHVAGLMTYDTPEIGLLTYRVLPLNLRYELKEGAADPVKKEDWQQDLYGKVLAAIEMAAKKGARVINLSLTLREKAESERSPEDNEKAMALMQGRRRQVADLMKRYPQIAFVAAAGNEGAWVDENSRLQLPCGVDAPNLICVGALDEKSQLASFSNVVMTDGLYIAAPGKGILSLHPTLMCKSEFLMSLMSEHFPIIGPALMPLLKKDCEKNQNLGVLSGTSMASPIVARVVAKILIQNPNLSGAEALHQLFEKAEPMKFGRVQLDRLRVERPSWYPVESGGAILNPASVCRDQACQKASRGFFELFTDRQSL